MRILHIISSYNGGIYSFIRSKYEYTQSEAITFDIVALEEAPEQVKDEVERQNGQVYYVSNPKKSGWKLFKKELSSFFEQVTYDAVHCHLNGYRAIPFYYMTKDLPFIIHAHNAGQTEDGNPSVFTRLTHQANQWINRRLTNYPVTCSTVAADYIFGNKWSEANPVTLLPNSIEEGKYKVERDNELKKRYIIPQNKTIVGQVGRLDPNKNQLFTIQLAKELKEITNDYFWILIGEGRERKTLERKIKKYALEDTVKLLGRIDDVSECYQMMDALVFPSKNEGFGIVAVEAQASGVYSLLSDKITKEVDLGLGLVTYLPLTDPKKWADSILKRPDESQFTSEEIKKALNNKQLTNEKAAQKYIDFLHKVVEE